MTPKTGRLVKMNHVLTHTYTHVHIILGSADTYWFLLFLTRRQMMMESSEKQLCKCPESDQSQME